MRRDIAIFSLAICLLATGAFAQKPVRTPAPKPTPQHIVWVILKEQPMAEAAERWQPALRQRLEEIDLALRAFAGNPAVTPEMLAGAHVAAQIQSAEALNTYRLLVYVDSVRPLMLSRAKLTSQVSRLGGRVLTHLPFLNSFAVSVPPQRVRDLLKIPGVAAVWYPPVLQPQLDVSTPTLFAPAVWDEGYTAPTWAVAIMDTGVNYVHTALNTHTWIIPNRTVPGLGSGIQAFHDYGRLDTNYSDDYMTARDLNGHGTYVSGAALANSATRKGVAPFAGYGVILKAGYQTKTGPGSLDAADALIALDWAAREAPLPQGVGIAGINFSFGGATNLDDDILTQAFDAFIYTYQIPLSIAAGNGGGPEKKLFTPAPAYNGIAVAASDDRNTLTRTDDVIAGFSSRGPTIAGRKKPDVTVPGAGITTTSGSGSSFSTVSGTSLAAPHVAGALALLHDVGVHDPLLLKAVLINSAEDRGAAGWDKEWGWGYVDLRSAMQHIVNRQYATGSVKPAGMSGSVAYFRTRLPAGGKVTLVWHRHAGFSPSSGYTYLRALANLKLTLIDESTGNIIGTSASTIDNVQQVVSPNAYSRVLVKVEATSAFDQYLTEPFALASSGILVPVTSP
ncbi:Serine protease AprX [bacterium HR16]|nr:Serine protease AprX [bacterium HR16]